MAEKPYSRDTIVSNELEHNSDLFKFEDCVYYLTIPISVNPIKKSSWPKFDSVIIQTCWKGEEKKPTCITSDRKDYANIKDRENFGEFVFLLAAKLKYDLLRGISYDNAGFLHSDHIAKLIEGEDHKRRTTVPYTIYTSLKRLVRWAEEARTNETTKQERKEHLRFLNRFFFEQSQLWHLICYSGVTTCMNLVWWLNIPKENILFIDENGKTIIDESVFKNLFPKHCLVNIEKSKQNELKKKIAKNSRVTLTIKAKREREKKLQKELIDKIRKKLIQEATWHLKDKLKSSDVKDYQPLDLEIGTIKNEQQNKNILQEDDSNVQPGEHGCVWDSYDIENLNNFQKTYILSSDVGTGKTTFLRNFQLSLLKKCKRIPVYIHASKIEEWQDIDYTSLEKHLEKKLGSSISGEIPGNFWPEVFKKNLVLLIDGLDQISGVGTDYRNFLDDILNLATSSKVSMMIASRPIAVISVERNENVSFLRLKAFSFDVQKTYFNKYFDRASEICEKHKDMLGIPMLAYMVRKLIKNEQDKKIHNRASLYEAFANYVLNPDEYKSGFNS